MIVRCIALLLSLTLSAFVSADPSTIGGFRADCIDLAAKDATTPEEIIKQVGTVSLCLGYVSGVMDGFRAGGGLVDVTMGTGYGSTQALVGICPPNAGLSIQEQIGMLDRYARGKGIGDEETTRSIFLLALRDTYPCGGHVPGARNEKSDP